MVVTTSKDIRAGPLGSGWVGGVDLPQEEVTLPRAVIEEIVAYLYSEAAGYARIGGDNECWGLVHGAKTLERALKKEVKKRDKNQRLAVVPRKQRSGRLHVVDGGPSGVSGPFGERAGNGSGVESDHSQGRVGGEVAAL